MESKNQGAIKRIARSTCAIGAAACLFGAASGCAGKVIVVGDKEAIKYRALYEQCNALNEEYIIRIDTLRYSIEEAERIIDELEQCP